MKKQIKFISLICILIVLLSACNSDMKNSDSVQEMQSTTAADTVTGQQPQYTNGELTQNLAKELNELFDGGTYYFKEVTDTFQDENTNLQVSVEIKDGNNYCSINNNNSVAGELPEGNKGLLLIDGNVYSIEDSLKQVQRITGKSVLFGTAEKSISEILPPATQFTDSSFINQIPCETYTDADKNLSYNYFYKDSKLYRVDCLKSDGDFIWSSTIEYSKEIDKSVFEFPKDYEIVDIDVGN